MSPEMVPGGMIAAIGLADRREREQQLYDMLQAQQNAMMNAAQSQYGDSGAQGLYNSGQLNQATSDRNHEIALQQAKMQAAITAKTPKRPPDFVTREDLNHPVFQLSVNTLRDVWLAKFGTTWVEQDNIDNADDPRFWALARTRMQGLQMLETVAINNNGGLVGGKAFRIKQDPDASY